MNFLDRYIHAAGRSLVPRVFHEWSCISLIAAALADRVWFEKFPDDKMHPNLYVILIGPSGLGKGIAIKIATKFATTKRYAVEINPYQGKVSGAAFADVLAPVASRDEDGKVQLDSDTAPVVYLVTPELSMSLGSGKFADDFIKRMTALWEGGDYIYRENARTNNINLSYRVPTVNWIGGSTEDWLHGSVSRDAIVSGFFGRAIPVKAAYDLNKRITDPTFPPDRAETVEWMHRRMRQIVALEGRFELSNKAQEVRDAWLQNRPLPDDEALFASWMRQDDLALKVGICLAVCSGKDDFCIRAAEFQHAIQLIQRAHQAIPDLIKTASRSLATTALDVVEGFVKVAGRIPHSALLKKVTHRGIHAKDLQMHIATLKEKKQVIVDRTNGGGAVYVWAQGTEVFDA